MFVSGQNARWINGITLARIGLTPVVALLMLSQGAFWKWIALIVFALAALSDFLDGFLARKMNGESRLGRILDPISDKILVCVILVMLIAIGHVSGWALVPALIIITREIAMASLREYAAEVGLSLRVAMLSKWKTALQSSALGFLIVGEEAETIVPFALVVGHGLLWIAGAVTLLTLWNYGLSVLKHAEGMDKI